MDANTATGWLGFINAVPLPLWAFLASFVIGAAVPWIVESLVPLTEWGNWKFRIITWGIAIVLGTLAAVTVWTHIVTITLGWTAALAAQIAREVAAQKWPFLSPRAAITFKHNAEGDLGVKVGSDPTVYVKPTDTH